MTTNNHHIQIDCSRLIVFCATKDDAQIMSVRAKQFFDQQKINYAQTEHQLIEGFAIDFKQLQLSEQQKITVKDFLQKNQHESANHLLFESNALLRNIKLAVFDMDSTLIQTEVIDELAYYAGVEQQVKKITEQAMQGNINFSESFKQRIGLLKGIHIKKLDMIAQRLPLMPGLLELFSGLKNNGIKTAIISGGFQFFADFLQTKLQADLAFANQLAINDEELTGSYIGSILDPKKKQQLLQTIAKNYGIPTSQTLAVGDGANDVLMLQAAGIGLAFHAKPLLKSKTQYHIDNVSLDALLVLLNAK